MTEEKNTIWMPVQEAEALKAWYEDKTEEQIRQHSYFFWNNFSMEGYDEWREQQAAEVRN
jgi:hypothetical protein